MQENFFKNDSILNNIALGNKADKNKIKKHLLKLMPGLLLINFLMG